MSVADDLTGIAADLDTLTGAVKQAAVDAGVAPSPSVGDTLLTSLVSALTDAGYTVTPPAPAVEG